MQSWKSNLHGGYGGKESKRQHEPSEAEGLALTASRCCGASKAQDSSHEDFFTLVSDVALNAEATSQDTALVARQAQAPLP